MSARFEQLPLPTRATSKAPKVEPVGATLLDEDVLRVLSGCVVEHNVVKLPPERLDPKLYKRVDEVLRTLGGKWNRKSAAHIFDADPSAYLDEVIVSGRVTTDKDVGFFPTPADLARRMVALAEVSHGAWVLEPSAGSGVIARAVRDAGGEVHCVEYDERRAEGLRADGFECDRADFLAWRAPGVFDAVVMNPPFARRQDIAHVTRALSLLKPGGRLVSVMSGGVELREDALALEFRALVSSHGGTLERLPDGTFRESGTGVRTVLVTMTASEVSR